MAVGHRGASMRRVCGRSTMPVRHGVIDDERGADAVRAAQPTTRAPRANAAPRPAQRTRRVLTTRLGVVRVCGRSRSAACRALAAAAASCPDPRLHVVQHAAHLMRMRRQLAVAGHWSAAAGCFLRRGCCPSTAAHRLRWRLLLRHVGRCAAAATARTPRPTAPLPALPIRAHSTLLASQVRSCGSSAAQTAAA